MWTAKLLVESDGVSTVIEEVKIGYLAEAMRKTIPLKTMQHTMWFPRQAFDPETKTAYYWLQRRV